jgi:hypothetical protein
MPGRLQTFAFNFHKPDRSGRSFILMNCSRLFATGTRPGPTRKSVFSERAPKHPDRLHFVGAAVSGVISAASWPARKVATDHQRTGFPRSCLDNTPFDWVQKGDMSKLASCLVR